MRTLEAQRRKKQIEQEYRRRAEVMDQILWEAGAEMAKLESFLSDFEFEEEIFQGFNRQAVEEYREDDGDVYFEQGVIER
jgi:hypothetical protein